MREGIYFFFFFKLWCLLYVLKKKVNKVTCEQDQTCLIRKWTKFKHRILIISSDWFVYNPINIKEILFIPSLVHKVFIPMHMHKSYNYFQRNLNFSFCDSGNSDANLMGVYLVIVGLYE